MGVRRLESRNHIDPVIAPRIERRRIRSAGLLEHTPHRAAKARIPAVHAVGRVPHLANVEPAVVPSTSDARVDSTAQVMKDRENARNVVLVANSALAAGATLPTSDAAALIDALQAGITAQPANLTFKVNLSDAEKGWGGCRRSINWPMRQTRTPKARRSRALQS
jgi:hypothetical protein